jgi:ferredoxin
MWKRVGLSLLALLGCIVYVERAWFVRGSTWRLLQAKQRLRDGSFLHSFIYARWPREYIGLGLRYSLPHIDAQAKRNAADGYHGKVLPTELAKRLVSVQRDIPLRDVEQILPYSKARELVLMGPTEIVAMECPCRATRRQPCQPTQVCMIVGQPFVDFVLEHHPSSSRRLSTTEAVQLLEEEHRRGHVHAAYFKDVMLGRFYAICNCCKCCCGGIEAMTRHGVPMIAASGYLAQVDTAVCTACGICQRVCAFDAIQVNEIAQVDWQKCMGCGACEGRCPRHAVTLVRDERKGVPLDVAEMF